MLPAIWGNNVVAASSSFFQITSNGTISSGRVQTGNFAQCGITGTITPVASTALYSVSMTLSGCTIAPFNGTYSGLATSRTLATPDDRLVVTVTSGTASMNGEFQ